MAATDTGPENRRDRRYAIRVPIYVELGREIVHKKIPLESRDISAGGLSFESSREMPLAAETQIVLARLGDGKGPAAIRGHIVWTRALPETRRHLVGVKFTEYEGVTREDLAARIEAVAREQAAG
jgi:c-di-GMP-binding flagellar brake protein YcgR